TKCSILGLPRCRGIPFAASRLETFTPSIATNSSNTNPSEAPPITAALTLSYLLCSPYDPTSIHKETLCASLWHFV
ncbi:MAG: hypothetical protein O9253_01210, partial [Aquidulcibacter sp.]|nr:hypothetical protein [Aquidulcibacter sp.]